MKFWVNLTWNLTDCPPHLSDVATVPWDIQKSHFHRCYSYIDPSSDYLCYLTRKQSLGLIHLPTPPENVITLTCELQNFFIWLKVHCVLSNVGRSEKSQLWIVNRGLWKEPVVMCGNWNVRQAMSQQMFRVTTFCVNKCFRSFSTLFSRIVHHAVLKFSPCRNKPRPQASMYPYQYTHSSCSMPQMKY